MLAALGMGSAAITELTAQGRALTASDIEGALAIQRRDIPDDEVALIRRALQRSLDDFQRVRELEIGDDVSLPIVFSPGRG